MSSNYIERPRYVCALGGAAATITALPGGIPILHSASGCAGNFAWAQNGGSGLQVGGYCGTLSIPSSNVQERDVVFGGDDRLREQIDNTIRIMDGKIFAVLSGCVTEVIGDDVNGVVSDFRSQGVPIVSAETAGFKGNSYLGYDLALQAIFRQFVEPGAVKNKKKVNLWGVAPSADPFWRGNIEGVRRMLENLGLTVNSFFTSEDTIENIREAGTASLNIVVSHVYGIEAAKVFEKIHDTPYISQPLPIGPTASEAFLRNVAKTLKISKNKVNSAINREKNTYYQFLEPLTDCFNDIDLQRYAVVVGDANYSAALTKFLADDLGWLPKLTICTDPLNDDEQERLKGQLAQLESNYKTSLVFESDGSKVLEQFQKTWPVKTESKYVNAFSPAFVIGSSLEREFAQQIGAPHLSVTFPVANRAVLDTTVTTPYLADGTQLDADILVYSTSKYINGTGTTIGGAIIDRGVFNWNSPKYPHFAPFFKKYRAFAFTARARKLVHKDVGACAAPFNSFLLTEGIQTLALRMDRHCANALALALFLKEHPKVAWVSYPGLEDSPHHEVATRLYGGLYGGLIAFGTGDKASAFRLINNLRLAKNLANIGDAKTLVIHPASTICSDYSLEEKLLLGVTEDLIRISAGIEDIRDIIEDFSLALNNI